MTKAGPATRYAFVVLACASTAVAAQTTVDLRARGAFARTLEFSGNCTVIGDGTKGRPDGLTGVSTAVRTRDGAIVVVNAGSNELLRFTATGQFDRALMGRGGGPGELSAVRNAFSHAIRVAAYRGDSLLVYDDGARRVSILAPGGTFVRSFAIPADVAAIGRQLFLAGALPESGDFVLFGRPTSPPPRPDASGTTKFRGTISIVRLSADGAIVWFGRDIEDAMTELAGAIPQPNGRGRASGMSFAPNTPGVFRAHTVVATAGFVYHYAERVNELHAWHRDGTLAYRALLPPLSGPNDFVGPSVRETLRMFADATGRVWLEVSRKASPRMREWWVFSPTLTPVGTALIPNRNELMHVSETSAILRAIDDDLVQTLRVCAAPRAP